MTVTEAILSFPGLENTNPLFLEKTLLARNLFKDDDYNVSKDGSINLAAADIFSAAVSAPDFSEGNLSVKYPRSFMISQACKLYRENGEPAKAESLSRKFILKGKPGNQW